MKHKKRLAGIRHFFRIGSVQWLMLIAYIWVWFRRKIRFPHKPEKLSRIHLRHARRFKRAASHLKGANIKVGQLASLQAHILPKEYITELKSLRDEVTPTEYELVAEMIRDEFGKGPLELFESFEETPIAAASMAQVHRALLKTGEEVVVKVLHPGLEKSVEIDLWLTRRMIGVLRLIFRQVDLRQLYREAEIPLREELDLIHEGKATEEMAGPLAELDVVVPKVYWEFTSRRMLTLSFIDGVSLSNRAQMDEWKVDRKALMETYLRAFFRLAFEDGYFHCDPHPANAFCMRDGRLALLDFGMVKRMPEYVRVGLVKEILGGFFNNETLYADGIIERGVVDESERETLESFAREIFTDEKMRSAVFDHDLSEGDISVLLGKLLGLLKDLKTFKTPQDQLMFLRALGIVIDVCREVYPEESVSDLSRRVVMPVFMSFLQDHPQYMEWASAAFSDQFGGRQEESGEPVLASDRARTDTSST
jgi:predicted unusual protein kinase regulating ubiquinone biosynthesis (AarF/ABC1/UbiB family)